MAEVNVKKGKSVVKVTLTEREARDIRQAVDSGLTDVSSRATGAFFAFVDALHRAGL